MVCKKTQELISYKLAAMKANNYSPELHKDKKYLTIIACHTDKVLKIHALINNLKYLDFLNNDIIIVNSANTMFDENDIKNETMTRILDYIEIPNDSNTLDFGKYMVILEKEKEKYNYLNYDFVVFINDSIVINSNINHFYNIMVKKNVELYGYNSSSECKYHYQSYLFGIKSSSVHKFIRFFNEKKHLLTGWKSVVDNLELNLVDIFDSKDCFLDLALVFENIYKNITYNDELFNVFFNTNIFSFTKVKRMI